MRLPDVDLVRVARRRIPLVRRRAVVKYGIGGPGFISNYAAIKRREGKWHRHARWDALRDIEIAAACGVKIPRQFRDYVNPARDNALVPPRATLCKRCFPNGL